MVAIFASVIYAETRSFGRRRLSEQSAKRAGGVFCYDLASKPITITLVLPGPPMNNVTTLPVSCARAIYSMTTD
jgi:hypothetical protein